MIGGVVLRDTRVNHEDGCIGGQVDSIIISCEGRCIVVEGNEEYLDGAQQAGCKEHGEPKHDAEPQQGLVDSGRSAGGGSGAAVLFVDSGAQHGGTRGGAESSVRRICDLPAVAYGHWCFVEVEQIAVI